MEVIKTTLIQTSELERLQAKAEVLNELREYLVTQSEAYMRANNIDPACAVDGIAFWIKNKLEASCTD